VKNEERIAGSHRRFFHNRKRCQQEVEIMNLQGIKCDEFDTHAQKKTLPNDQEDDLQL
jgi:hypothetical protein